MTENIEANVFGQYSASNDTTIIIDNLFIMSNLISNKYDLLQCGNGVLFSNNTMISYSVTYSVITICINES